MAGLVPFVAMILTLLLIRNTQATERGVVARSEKTNGNRNKQRKIGVTNPDQAVVQTEDVTQPVAEAPRPEAFKVVGTSFVVLFSIVGLALWGLPFFYDFMVQQFGWTRGQVTSGNALSKLVVGPLFGFLAGWVVDRFGPRRIMMAGI